MTNPIGWGLLLGAAVILIAFLCARPAKTRFFQIEDLQSRDDKESAKHASKDPLPEEFQAEILGILHGVNPGGIGCARAVQRRAVWTRPEY